eukprot:1138808-Pelagomonas_calceolata.AAC.4
MWLQASILSQECMHLFTTNLTGSVGKTWSPPQNTLMQLQGMDTIPMYMYASARHGSYLFHYFHYPAITSSISASCPP